MRGLYTAGVIDVMMENGIVYDGLIGVSAGSSFGCNYKSHQPGRVIRYNTRFAKDPRYMGLRSLVTTGNYINAEFAYHYIPLNVDIFDVATFEADPMEFIAVCTDCLTGKPVYYRMDRVTEESLEWLRASASMPLITRPIEVEGRVLLDGGISDSVPLKYFQSRGYERNVVVLTRPRNYRKEPSKMLAFRLLLRKYPAIVEAMAHRHEMYNAQLRYVEQEEKAGRAFVIAPKEDLPIDRLELDVDKMNKVYQIGRNHGEEILPRLKEWLGQ